MHALLILLVALGVNRTNNSCDALIDQLPKVVLGHVQINLVPVLLINLIVNLSMKAWDGI